MRRFVSAISLLLGFQCCHATPAIVSQDPILATAIQAGLAAGKYINTQYELKNKDVSTKQNRFDLVTNIDVAANDMIVKAIRQAFPQHGIFSEEGQQDASKAVTWIIDPIDGTTNFVHNYPDFAVSIGVVKAGVPYAGVIVQPYTNDLYYAVRGHGAWLNHRSITVSKGRSLTESLISTEFPFKNRNLALMDNYWPTYKAFYSKAHNVLISGSTVLELAYVAAGRLDAYVNIGDELSPWDIAAGCVIVQEAGGIVLNKQLQPMQNLLTAHSVVAINGSELKQDILSILQVANTAHQA